MKRILRIAAILAAGLLLAAPVQAQTTRYVATTGSDAGGCTGEGDPCATISYALSQSNSGDVIDIAVGAYTEPDGIEIDRSITLQGAGRELPDGTAIQAHAQPGQAESGVFTIMDGLVVDIIGVTIRHGNAGSGGGIHINDGSTVSLNNVTLRDNEALIRGGGIYIASGVSPPFPSVVLNNVTFSNNTARFGGGMNTFNTSPELTNVQFEDNEAESGGGLMVEGTANELIDVILTNVAFRRNVAEENGGGLFLSFMLAPMLNDVRFNDNNATRGGGIFSVNVNNDSFILSEVTFSENEAFQGGGMHNQTSSPQLIDVTFSRNETSSGGGGMRNESSSPTLIDVVFSENTAGGSGGGMANFNGSSPTLTNVAFRGNSTSFQGGGIINGGNEGVSSPTLTNVIFLGNRACCGGGMRNGGGSSPTLINVSFSGNVATTNSGGGISNLNGHPILSNVIMWNNQSAGSTSSALASIGNADDASEPHISHSLIANSGGSDDWNNEIGVDGGDNIDVDPQFFHTPDPDDAPTTVGNLRISEVSPAIDMGEPDTDPLIFPTDGNGNPIDLLGNPRFFPDEESIDMGAYEWQPLGDMIFQDRFEQ